MIGKIAFSVTHSCPISCKYCVTRSRPGKGPSLDAGFMKAVIDEVMAIAPLSTVVFTGGEALLELRAVEETIRHATAQGIWTRIVSNAFWAKQPATALRVLQRLRRAGLSEINISCDDLHQEHLPIENVRNAFDAAKRCGLPVLIAHKKVAGGRITPEYLSSVLGVELTEYAPGDVCNEASNLYSTSLTVPIGTGVESLPLEDYILYPEHACAWMHPCGAVLDGLVIAPDRQLHLCCGMMEQTNPELSLGRVEPGRIAELLYAANSDLLANWLALEGPYGLMQFIRQRAPQVTFAERFVNSCHLCNDIFTRPDCRKVLAECAAEKEAELSLRRGILEVLRYEDGGAAPPSSLAT